MRMVKDNGVERRLHRRELAYLSADDLRSMSDKALGALRLAVADNEHLRDVLRMSEDPKRPDRKIQFFVAVYQHPLKPWACQRFRSFAICLKVW